MELDNRKVVILTTIIKNYLETGEPVGSRTISKYSGLNLSSATIRNEMSDLEEMGFIVQPHTSAGRIPSDKGYRFYVDQLMQSQAAELEKVRSGMVERVDRLETVLKKLVRTLAANTNYAAMISGPAVHRNKIKYIQVSHVDVRRLLVVIMMQGSIVRTAMVSTDGTEELDFNAVLSMNLVLNDELSGLTGEDITEGRCAQIFARTPYKSTMRSILQTISSTLSQENGEIQIYTSGATNIFKYPELSDSSNAERLISAFEQKDALKDLIQDADADARASKQPIQVYIGSEAPLDRMEDCSVVTASYELGHGLKGTVGVIGPKRMDYEKVLETMYRLMHQMEEEFQS